MAIDSDNSTSGSNVVPLVVPKAVLATIELVIPLDDVATARRLFDKLKTICGLAVKTLDEAPHYSDAQVLRAVRRLFDASAGLLEP
jgi:hypothetical protein